MFTAWAERAELTTVSMNVSASPRSELGKAPG